MKNTKTFLFFIFFFFGLSPHQFKLMIARTKIIFLFLFFLIGIGMYAKSSLAACEAACTKAGAVYTCTDASYDCVNDAVNSASDGDTRDIVNSW